MAFLYWLLKVLCGSKLELCIFRVCSFGCTPFLILGGSQMKRILAFLMALVMVFVFAACSEDKPDKYCTNCGKGISNSVSFCQNCGAAVNDTSSETETSSANETSSIPESSSSSKPSTTSQNSSKPTQKQNCCVGLLKTICRIYKKI